MKNLSKTNKGAIGILIFIGLFFFGITYLQGVMPWGLLIPFSILGMLFSMVYTIFAVKSEEIEQEKPKENQKWKSYIWLVIIIIIATFLSNFF